MLPPDIGDLIGADCLEMPEVVVFADIEGCKSGFAGRHPAIGLLSGPFIVATSRHLLLFPLYMFPPRTTLPRASAPPPPPPAPGPAFTAASGMPCRPFPVPRASLVGTFSLTHPAGPAARLQ